MRIAFYEDDSVTHLEPIALLRPVFELLCGQFSLRERLLRRFDVSEWGVFVRPELAETYHELYPAAHVNKLRWLSDGTTLLVNGRWLPSFESLSLLSLSHNEVGLSGDQVVALALDPDEATLLSTHGWDMAVSQLARLRKPRTLNGTMIARPWDLVNHNPKQLEDDFRLLGPLAGHDFGPHVAVLGPAHTIHVDPTAIVDPFVVIDARSGPVSIGARAAIRSFTALEGPCHVGNDSQLFRAHVRGGTTIGPVCRVGGEIEASILHSHVNKYHTGFLGHSYICPWVNLGALTTNSDLKNDYSAVRVPLDGELVETGMTKVGCFIGDHTKTALGSLFNTGTSVGVLSMVLPGGELLPKYIPSFSSVWHGELSEGWDIERALETARVAMSRRDCELTPAMERLLRRVYDQTEEQRRSAIEHFRDKRANRSKMPIG